MTREDDSFIIASQDLSIYIQSSTEEGAKKGFYDCVTNLIGMWADRGQMINQLKARGLVRRDEEITNGRKPKVQIPDEILLGLYTKGNLVLA